MKNKQIILIGAASALFVLILFLGRRVPAKKNIPATTAATTGETHSHEPMSFNIILSKAKERITAEQSQRLTNLENSVVRGDVKEQQLHVYHQLARFWADSAHSFEPYAYYTGKAAELENSEKSLTFAARLFIERLMIQQDAEMQNWLAANAKVLLEKALVINPNNDSSKIGLGACYILGHISDNPMTGILPVKAIADEHPDNLYAQLVLGLGGKKSGQYDKAIERFKIIVDKDPQDLEAKLHLAECYDLKGDKASAIKWYELVKSIIPNPEAKKELDERIKLLKG